MATQVPDPPWWDESGAPTDQFLTFIDMVNGIETEVVVTGDDLSETTEKLDAGLQSTSAKLDAKSGIRHEKVLFTGRGASSVSDCINFRVAGHLWKQKHGSG